MEHLQTYNESIRDKMTAKVLTGTSKMFYDANEDIKSIGLRTNFLGSENGIYKLKITNMKDMDLEVFYIDNEEIESKFKGVHKKPQKTGWELFTHLTGDGKNERKGYGSDDWSVILNTIIDICFTDIDSIINNIETNIESMENSIISNKKFLKGVKRAKKIKGEHKKE